MVKRDERRVKDEDLFKTVEEVFDKATLEALYYLGAVAAGKESKLYLALSPQEELIAVKIYLTSSSEFRKGIVKYIDGDPRFRHVKRDTRSIIYTWAQKEFKNLERAYEAGVRVPRPIAVYRNVLVMEFIGDEAPAPIMKEVELEDPRGALETLMVYIHRLYHKAKLVHGDLSEYNVMVRGGELVIFDFGQAMLTSHPMAIELLRRDVANVLHYFHRIGELEEEPSIDEAMKAVLKPEEEAVKQYVRKLP
ncbi:serine/threonine protein kinase [Candidatus Geothermarchaeota archaeon ex4572_27]|nr:MAG: serine/threonine protein kinase [Candidatus Geothermarchaeota archaeon ex4572_27]